uniref:G_PROTEIN_RECEP_F1_2 domain-containing protein n=1 Tax=Steinernema glaseri TaxID=37863 RepID=A0A1I7ZHH4_9BILA
MRNSITFRSATAAASSEETMSPLLLASTFFVSRLLRYSLNPGVPYLLETTDEEQRRSFAPSALATRRSRSIKSRSKTAMSQSKPLDDYLVFAVLRIVGFVFATLGNGFIVYLILRSKAVRRERFNLLIVLLAIGDIVLGIAALARIITQIWRNGHYTKFTCLISGSLIIYGGHITQLAVLLIAAERLYGIWNIHAVHITRLKWVYNITIPASLSVCLIPVVMLFVGISDGEVNSCQIGLSWHPNFGIYMLAHMIFFNASIFVLYVLIVILYHKKVGSSTATSKNNFMSIIAGVAVVYVSCWMVPKILSFVFVSRHFAEVSQVIAVFGELLSAVLNFFVYGMAHKEIRKQMWGFFLMRNVATVAPASALTGF